MRLVGKRWWWLGGGADSLTPMTSITFTMTMKLAGCIVYVQNFYPLGSVKWDNNFT